MHERVCGEEPAGDGSVYACREVITGGGSVSEPDPDPNPDPNSKPDPTGETMYYV